MSDITELFDDNYIKISLVNIVKNTNYMFITFSIDSLHSFLYLS